MDLKRSIFFQHTLSRNRFTRTWIHNHTHTNKYLVYLSDQFLYSTPIFCVVYVKPIASKVIEFILKWLLIHKQITAYSTKIQKYTPTHTLPHTCYTYINSYRVQPCTLASRQPTNQIPKSIKYNPQVVYKSFIQSGSRTYCSNKQFHLKY